MQSAVLNVGGMSCQSCVAQIEKNLSSHSGVEEVKVDLPHHHVQVQFDETVTSLKKIKEAIENLGFDVSKL